MFPGVPQSRFRPRGVASTTELNSGRSDGARRTTAQSEHCALGRQLPGQDLASGAAPPPLPLVPRRAPRESRRLGRPPGASPHLLHPHDRGLVGGGGGADGGWPSGHPAGLAAARGYTPPSLPDSWGRGGAVWDVLCPVTVSLGMDLACVLPVGVPPCPGFAPPVGGCVAWRPPHSCVW